MGIWMIGKNGTEIYILILSIVINSCNNHVTLAKNVLLIHVIEMLAAEPPKKSNCSTDDKEVAEGKM